MVSINHIFKFHYQQIIIWKVPNPLPRIMFISLTCILQSPKWTLLSLSKRSAASSSSMNPRSFPRLIYVTSQPSSSWSKVTSSYQRQSKPQTKISVLTIGNSQNAKLRNHWSLERKRKQWKRMASLWKRSHFMFVQKNWWRCFNCMGKLKRAAYSKARRRLSSRKDWCSSRMPVLWKRQ